MPAWEHLRLQGCDVGAIRASCGWCDATRPLRCASRRSLPMGVGRCCTPARCASARAARDLAPALHLTPALQALALCHRCSRDRQGAPRGCQASRAFQQATVLLECSHPACVPRDSNPKPSALHTLDAQSHLRAPVDLRKAELSNPSRHRASTGGMRGGGGGSARGGRGGGRLPDGPRREGLRREWLRLEGARPEAPGGRI
jgi:hypothetical protein